MSTDRSSADLQAGLPRVALASHGLGPRDAARRYPAGFPARGAGLRPVCSLLTDREWETLDLLAVGRSTAEIADELVLSLETVRTHVKRLLHKLQLHSRAEAVAWAEALRAELLRTMAADAS